jgi:hypothetical protein
MQIGGNHFPSVVLCPEDGEIGGDRWKSWRSPARSAELAEPESPDQSCSAEVADPKPLDEIYSAEVADAQLEDEADRVDLLEKFDAQLELTRREVIYSERSPFTAST